MNRPAFPKVALVGFCLVAMATILAGTVHASLEKNVWKAFADLGSDRWGLATLGDAYFGFFTVWILTAAQLPGWGRKLAWLAAFLSLGNLAMPVWLLWHLRGWDGRGTIWGYLAGSRGASS